MIYELFDKGYLQKETLLIRHYKIVGLNENQLVIVMLLSSLSNEANRIYTPTELAYNMTISKEQIEIEIQDLLKKQLIKLDSHNDKKFINLSPLYNSILFQISEKDKNSGLSIKDIYSFIRKQFNIKLTDREKEFICEELKNSITKHSLLEALSVSKNIKSSQDIIKLIDELKDKADLHFTRINWLSE